MNADDRISDVLIALTDRANRAEERAERLLLQRESCVEAHERWRRIAEDKSRQLLELEAGLNLLLDGAAGAYGIENVPGSIDDVLSEIKRLVGERCHCGARPVYGYDGDPTHTRGLCEHCDLVRCDAYPGECGR